MWSHALNLFHEYMGTGLIVIWFLVALVYLWITEKRKHIKILFLYVPVLLLILFFNPIFAKVVYEVAGDEIYYRVLWLLPMTIVTAYAIIDVFGKLEGIRRAVFAVVAVAVIMVSGSYIYDNIYFKKAENPYHMPQSVVDICDAIEVEGREVMALFPLELIQYVRQYSPVVCMPYGREVLVDAWAQWHELYDVIEAEQIDAKLLAEGCREYQVVYVVIPSEKPIIGRLEDYDFELFTSVEGYVVYKDSHVDLTAILK